MTSSTPVLCAIARRLQQIFSCLSTAQAGVAARRPKPGTRLHVDALETRLVPAKLGAASSYVGAAYGPYVGQWITDNGPKHPPYYNSYGSGNWSVQNQINLLATHFSTLATYTAGYGPYYKPTTPWNKVDSAWMVAGTAASYNRAQGRPALTVSQGIYQQVDNKNLNNPLMTAEIKGALQIAKAANATYAGTVKRLVFTNEYVDDAKTTTQVDQLIQQYRDDAHGMHVTIGVRGNTFGELINPKPIYLKEMQQLVKDCDFIMLNLYPAKEADGVAAGAKQVEDQYVKIRAAALKVNPKIEVLIGETGWPTQGISFNDLTGKYNTVANAKAYDAAIEKWANDTKTQTHIFAGIDEPWKSNLNQVGGNPWTGPNGAEGHYGLWYYNTNDESGKFIAKWPLTKLPAAHPPLHRAPHGCAGTSG
jgi:exo-beta-1,3-glucanase (GH17 family)